MTGPLSLLRPPRLRPGATIGVCTPSWPAHVLFPEKYRHGLSQLETLGFRVREGSLTATGTSQGYRSGASEARARELMELFEDSAVECIITTIGGNNSSSLIPYLDFAVIRNNPKIFCGYSDITSLHLAILAHAGLSTFYGPAVVPSFGEWPALLPETRDSFLSAVTDASGEERELVAPARFSRHFRDGKTDAWKTVPREFKDNAGPTVIYPGIVEAPCIVANLNTLLTAAGTSYFPVLDGKLLLIEQMHATLAQEERCLRHLERLGVFQRIAGLLIGKPELYSGGGAPFGYTDLVREIVAQRVGVPLVMDVDCGHTNPLFTIAQETRLRVVAEARQRARLFVLESMVQSRA